MKKSAQPETAPEVHNDIPKSPFACWRPMLAQTEKSWNLKNAIKTNVFLNVCLLFFKLLLAEDQCLLKPKKAEA